MNAPALGSIVGRPCPSRFTIRGMRLAILDRSGGIACDRSSNCLLPASRARGFATAFCGKRSEPRVRAPSLGIGGALLHRTFPPKATPTIPTTICSCDSGLNHEPPNVTRSTLSGGRCLATAASGPGRPARRTESGRLTRAGQKRAARCVRDRPLERRPDRSALRHARSKPDTPTERIRQAFPAVPRRDPLRDLTAAAGRIGDGSGLDRRDPGLCHARSVHPGVPGVGRALRRSTGAHRAAAVREKPGHHRRRLRGVLQFTSAVKWTHFLAGAGSTLTARASV